MTHLIDGFLSQLIRVTANKSALDNKLSGADHHLSFTLAFGVLATGIGTVEPATTALRNWVRQYLTAHYTAPLPIAALTFGNMPFPLRLLRSVGIIVCVGISSSDSGSSYHKSACVSRLTTSRQSPTVISLSASLRRELACMRSGGKSGLNLRLVSG
jgi:hypothetical protein